MINFKSIELADKTIYENYKQGAIPRGCEMSFGNLFLWGDQKIACINGYAVFFATFSKSFYPFPVGKGDIKPIVDEIILDAEERNLSLYLTSITEESKLELERLYPDRFEFATTENSYDYVYNIDDLAELAGKKYHKKRTHLRRFMSEHPDYQLEPFSTANIDKIKSMVEKWYKDKQAESTGEFDYEIEVFRRAIDNFDGLGLVGLALVDKGEVLAVTFGSKMHDDTFDVHFEKARTDVDGAYVAINNGFAKYVREKFPEIKYLDREEDMGIEGLRKAKLSYYPHHRIVKYTAREKIKE